ncbi:MAG: hypothetical protein JO239_09320 [Paraburkholderia sp.]|nr:hypothetical protein [Paraburkholderia sp.]
MHIERFLRVSRTYLRASPAVAPRLELQGHGRLWSHTSARAGQAAQRGNSVAALWTTQSRNVHGISWPA